MADTPPRSRQLDIEARAAGLAGVTLGAGQTIRDVYGEIDDWTFRLGPWQFLLDPVSQRWFVLDPAHDQYMDTGYRAGETVFELGEASDFSPAPHRAAE